METIPEVLPADDQEQRELGIVTTPDGQAVKFGRWRDATKTLAEIELTVETKYINVRALSLTDHETREQAGVLASQLKAETKNAEAVVTPFEIPLKRVLEFLRMKRQKIANRCEEARGILSAKMADYDRAEEAKAAAERNRQQQAIDAETQKQAKRELKAGNIGKREFAQRVENTPQVSVAPAIPKVAGNVRRVNYSAFCTDKGGFIHAMVSAYGKDKEKYTRLRDCLLTALSASVGQNKTALQQTLSAIARASIKVNPQDERHPLTVEAFKALYPFVEVQEDRTY